MGRKGEVTRAEWRWVIGWIIAALIITSIPYVIGWLRSTPDHVFGGFVLGIEDGYQYLSMMGEGARGAWLFHLPYTSEPHVGTLFYIFHLLLGKAAGLTGLSPILVYHLARLAFGALLLIVIYRFVAMFAATRAVRRIAFLLIVFSGGLGWLLILLGQSNWLGSPPIDLILPEGYTFLVLYGWPHIALTRTLLLLGLILLWDDRRAPGWRKSVIAGLCWLGMGLIVPFYVTVVYAVVVIGLVATTIAQRRLDWPDVGRTVLAGTVAAPILLYGFVVISTDPVWSQWSSQLLILSPHPLHYVAGYALLGGLALWTILRGRRLARHVGPDFPRLVGWVVIVPFMLYLPFVSQRRLLESWQIPLGILASTALVYRVLPAWRRSRLVRRLSGLHRYTASGLRRWALTGLVLFSFASYVLLLTEQSTRMIAQLPPSFRDGHELEALSWLNERATYDDVVLSSYDTGNFLPTQVGARVFVGHGPQTIHADVKRQLVATFFDGSTSDEWRQAFLREWPITYVFDGPLEHKLGDFDPSHADYLSLEYDRDSYQIYTVIGAPQ